MAYKNLFAAGKTLEGLGGSLVEQFGIPPFSVLDARSGAWQDRKAAWLSLGIKSELGRGENLLRFSDTVLELDPRKRAAANAKSSFRDQDKLTAIQQGKRGTQKATAEDFGSGGPATLGKQYKAIPGRGNAGGAWKFKTDDGYKTLDEIDARQKQSASLQGGKTFRVTTDAYRLEGEPASASHSGTSIFDPVLCELFYRWFVPKGGHILDPFAGGSVRGIIASRLGYHYLGTDIREEQIAANKAQADKLCKNKYKPGWLCCDARDIASTCAKQSQDAVWSCPPFGNLEEYSDDPRDISTLEYPEFLKEYSYIIEQTVSRLKPNRFAAYVVGEIRDKTGNYCGLVPDTVKAFQKAGLYLYNSGILITAVGSLSIRVGRQFKASRKLGNTHQHFLVFVKGDGAKAVQAIKDAENHCDAGA